MHPLASLGADGLLVAVGCRVGRASGRPRRFDLPVAGLSGPPSGLTGGRHVFRSGLHVLPQT
jgi:hypothetical protein